MSFPNNYFCWCHPYLILVESRQSWLFESGETVLQTRDKKLKRGGLIIITAAAHFKTRSRTKES